MEEKIESFNKIEKELGLLIDRMFAIIDKHTAGIQDSGLIFLKFHLLIEYIINQIIILYSGSEDGYKKSDDDFFDKVNYMETLKDLGIKGKETESLRRLNKVRNKLSHELEYKISESDIDSIGFCLGEEYIMHKFKLDFYKEENIKNLLIFVMQRVTGNLYKYIAKRVVVQKQ